MSFHIRFLFYIFSHLLNHHEYSFKSPFELKKNDNLFFYDPPAIHNLKHEIKHQALFFCTNIRFSFLPINQPTNTSCPEPNNPHSIPFRLYIYIYIYIHITQRPVKTGPIRTCCPSTTFARCSSPTKIRPTSITFIRPPPICHNAPTAIATTKRSPSWRPTFRSTVWKKRSTNASTVTIGRSVVTIYDGTCSKSMRVRRTPESPKAFRWTLTRVSRKRLQPRQPLG